MDPSTAIIVKTFVRPVDADIAAAQLRGRGIEYLITSDDCGGMYPSLELIKLMVAPEDEEAAREILGNRSDSSEAAATAKDGEQGRSISRESKENRFVWGIILGLAVGILVHIAYVEIQNQIAQKEGVDRDGDGRADAWFLYSNGYLVRSDYDDNYDGKKDQWYAYSQDGFATHHEGDTDFNGVSDVFSSYVGGVVVQTDWKPNGTNVVLFRQLFRHGNLREELEDTNGDGNFDVSVSYNAFNRPEATNHVSSSPRLSR